MTLPSPAPVAVRIPPGPVSSEPAQDGLRREVLVVVDPVGRSVGLLSFPMRHYPPRLWHQCEMGLAIPPGMPGEALARALESGEGQRLLARLLDHYRGETVDREGTAQGHWAPGVTLHLDALAGLLSRR